MVVRSPLAALCFVLLGAGCVDPIGAADPGNEAGEGEIEGEGEGEEEAPACAPAFVVAPAAFVVEGEVWTANVHCTRDDFALTLEGPPSMSLDAGALVFSPDLSAAGRAEASVRVAATGEEFAFVVDVDDATGAAANAPIVDPENYFRESGLPVLFLNGRPDEEVEIPAEVIAGGVRYTAAAKLRGASSLGYPKKSYTLDFDDVSFNDEAAGFVDREKLILTTTFDDQTAVRQRLAYEVWNAMSDVHSQIKTQSVVVYIDGVYEGVYLMSDQVNRDLFRNSLGLEKTGNLYKSIDHNANFRLTAAFSDDPKGSLRDGWETRDEPTLPSNLWSELEELTSFAATASDADFVAGLGDRIAIDDVIDWWVFVTLIEAGDSAGKNAYLYKVAGQPFRYAPWDFNHSFGQAWETSRTAATDPADYTSANEIFTRMMVLEPFASQMRRRYHDVVNGDLEVATMLALYDSATAETAAARTKDSAVWGDTYRGYFGRTETADEEVDYARAWIDERWATRRLEFPE